MLDGIRLADKKHLNNQALLDFNLSISKTNYSLLLSSQLFLASYFNLIISLKWPLKTMVLAF